MLLKWNEIDWNENHPIILRNGNSHFIKLLILKAYEDALHCGIEFTLNKIRSNFGQCEVERRWKVCYQSVLFVKRYQGNTLIPPESPINLE